MLLLTAFVVLLGGATHPPTAMDPFEEHELLMEHVARAEEAHERHRLEAEEAARQAEVARQQAEAAELAAEQARIAQEKPEPEPTPEPTATPAPSARSVWDRLAECESGNWINGGQSFEEGSARWYWARPGTELPPWGTRVHHGGLQFHPQTWTSYKLDGYPTYAYDASREQQIEVGKRVQAAQGWGAWPTCSSKLGLR